MNYEDLPIKEKRLELGHLNTQNQTLNFCFSFSLFLSLFEWNGENGAKISDFGSILSIYMKGLRHD